MKTEVSQVKKVCIDITTDCRVYLIAHVIRWEVVDIIVPAIRVISSQVFGWITLLNPLQFLIDQFFIIRLKIILIVSETEKKSNVLLKQQ